MAKRADTRIGQRMYEEAMRLFGTPTAAAKKMGCDRKMFYEWENGFSPSAFYLARLDALGGNVLYVITGRTS